MSMEPTANIVAGLPKYSKSTIILPVFKNIVKIMKSSVANKFN